jgi:flagellar hook-basal body complex protein FliE
MIQGITNAGMIRPAAPIQAPSAPEAPAGSTKNFHAFLLDNLDEVNRLQREADQGVQALLTGQTDDVAEVMTAVNKAGIAFDLLMEVRNKLLDAYREIQEMRV